MKFECVVHYEGAKEFIVDAETQEEAENEAERLFGEIPVTELADNLADAFVCDCIESKDKTMRVLIVEPGKEPYEKTIDTGLTSLQHEVGGCIEAVYAFPEPVALVVNDEGKLNGMELNRALRDETGKVYDVIAGTFMVVGLNEEEFCSLSDEYMEKFKAMYATPEMFARIGGSIVVIPMAE